VLVMDRLLINGPKMAARGAVIRDSDISAMFIFTALRYVADKVRSPID